MHDQKAHLAYQNPSTKDRVRQYTYSYESKACKVTFGCISKARLCIEAERDFIKGLPYSHL